MTRETAAAQANAVAPYANLDVLRLAQLVEAARARLAELETAFTLEKAKVDAVQAALFKRLGEHYRKRDRLRLLVSYRRKFLQSLLARDEAQADQVRSEFRQADSQTARDYDEAAAAMATKHELSSAERDEAAQLWRKLVKLYHPDKFASEPEKLASYEKLTAAINHAKDSGDVATLREIAAEPEAYILRQGWAQLDFGDEQQAEQLRRLLESLELEIAGRIEAMNELRATADYELAQMVEKDATLIDRVVAKQIAGIEAEVEGLAQEAERLAGQIAARTTSGSQSGIE